MARHNIVGKRGEELARDTLVAKGYAIVDMNVKLGNYELDIVAEKDGRIVFVEVKTRSSDDSDPLEAINRKKASYLCRAANAYIKRYDIPHEVQLDVITIVGDPSDSGNPVVEHYPDAIRPPLRTGR